MNWKLVDLIFPPLRNFFGSSFSAVADGFRFCVRRYDHFLVRRCGRIFAPGLRHWISSGFDFTFDFLSDSCFGFLLAVYRSFFLPSLSPPLRTMFVFGLHRCGWVWDFTFYFLSDLCFGFLLAVYRSFFAIALSAVTDDVCIWPAPLRMSLGFHVWFSFRFCVLPRWDIGFKSKALSFSLPPLRRSAIFHLSIL